MNFNIAIYLLTSIQASFRWKKQYYYILFPFGFLKYCYKMFPDVIKFL